MENGRWITRLGSVAALVLAGVLMGSVMLTPVGAHITTFNHLKAKHFYTKKAADARFVDTAEGDARYTNVAKAPIAKVATGGHFSVPSTTYTNVTGATATVDVPAGSNGLIIARFTASSICGPSGGCRVRILIGGVEGSPTEVSPYDTGGSDSSTEYEGHAVDRSATVGPGTYTVQVQAARGTGITFFDLDNWHLTVERFIV
jgi:hypothetical protein